MTVYRSKIDAAIVVPIALLLGVTYYLFIVNRIWLGMMVNSGLAFFILYLYFNTKYIVDEMTLVIRAGFFVHVSISIPDIERICATRNPLSAPAFSLDRIQLFYGKSKSVIISPQLKSIFVGHLQELNPRVTYIN